MQKHSLGLPNSSVAPTVEEISSRSNINISINFEREENYLIHFFSIKLIIHFFVAK